jgi:hypothetical protein
MKFNNSCPLFIKDKRIISILFTFLTISLALIPIISNSALATTANVWSEWRDVSTHGLLNVGVTGDLAVARNQDGRLEVFVRGEDKLK